MSDTPVVMVIGPRQCGKTTLVRDQSSKERVYLTLDDDTMLSAATSDPVNFLRNLDRVTIDEVQRAPNLLRAIKYEVDRDRRPGRYLLTGSANLLTLPGVSESLAGRMEIVSLYPLAMAELNGERPSFLYEAFAGRAAQPREICRGRELEERVLTGGYPEMLKRSDQSRRLRWARDYMRAIVERDVRDIAEIDKLDQMPHLLQVLAQYSGQLCNYAQVGAEIRLDEKTARKYLGILEQLFLVRRVAPWYRNELNRLVKTPKLHFLDSGLLAAMLGASAEHIATDRAVFGRILESFVYGEILKQASWLDTESKIYHYRDKDQNEVDLVLVDQLGRLIGIEIKASGSVNASDFRGLKKLALAAKDDFKIGMVMYDGEQTIAFGERLYAVPLSNLW